MKIHKILAIVHRVKNNKKEFLLLKTSPEPWRKASWYVITGWIEDGEDQSQASLRELSEETGMNKVLNITPTDLIHTYTDQRLNKVVNQKCFLIQVNSYSDKINLSLEHTDYKWVSKTEFIQKINWYGSKKDLIGIIKSSKFK